jgi:hypothetical protein
MSTYRRWRDGRTERWHSPDGEWRPCAPDEPETRRRGPNEGMVVLPAEKAGGPDGPPVVSVSDFLKWLRPPDPAPDVTAEAPKP